VIDEILYIVGHPDTEIVLAVFLVVVILLLSISVYRFSRGGSRYRVDVHFNEEEKEDD